MSVCIGFAINLFTLSCFIEFYINGKVICQYLCHMTKVSVYTRNEFNLAVVFNFLMEWFRCVIFRRWNFIVCDWAPTVNGKYINFHVLTTIQPFQSNPKRLKCGHAKNSLHCIFMPKTSMLNFQKKNYKAHGITETYIGLWLWKLWDGFAILLWKISRIKKNWSQFQKYSQTITRKSHLSACSNPLPQSLQS